MREGPTEQRLLTPRQVAERLEVSVRTLARMSKAEGFPKPIRYNRKLVRWRESDVDRYIGTLQAD